MKSVFQYKTRLINKEVNMDQTVVFHPTQVKLTPCGSVSVMGCMALPNTQRWFDREQSKNAFKSQTNTGRHWREDRK